MEVPMRNLSTTLLLATLLAACSARPPRRVRTPALAPIS
jgi:hypothetical protein